MTIETDVAAYWAEISGPIPYLSGSHFTLMRLYEIYGRSAVDAELAKHVAVEQAKRQRIQAEIAREFYAKYGINKDA